MALKLIFRHAVYKFSEGDIPRTSLLAGGYSIPPAGAPQTLWAERPQLSQTAPGPHNKNISKQTDVFGLSMAQKGYIYIRVKLNINIFYNPYT